MPEKELILGTAMWGWTIPNDRCFDLLDQFYQAGYRKVDSATNYPINKHPEDFRRSEEFLFEWVRAHQVKDLQVIAKVGSLNNLGSPEHLLTKSFLLLNLDTYAGALGSNLHTFMIHWDNRSDPAEIHESMEALREASIRGYRPGLSGIKHPELYAQWNQEFQLNFCVEFKCNLLQCDLPHYAPLQGQASFLAYGLNARGLKLNGIYTQQSTLMFRGGEKEIQASAKDQIRALIEKAGEEGFPMHSMNHLGMLHAYHQKGVEGLIIGPSNTTQLADSIGFFRQLQQGGGQAYLEQIQSISF